MNDEWMLKLCCWRSWLLVAKFGELMTSSTCYVIKRSVVNISSLDVIADAKLNGDSALFCVKSRIPSLSSC